MAASDNQRYNPFNVLYKMDNKEETIVFNLAVSDVISDGEGRHSFEETGEVVYDLVSIPSISEVIQKAVDQFAPVIDMVLMEEEVDNELEFDSEDLIEGSLKVSLVYCEDVQNSPENPGMEVFGDVSYCGADDSGISIVDFELDLINNKVHVNTELPSVENKMEFFFNGLLETLATQLSDRKKKLFEIKFEAN